MWCNRSWRFSGACFGAHPFFKEHHMERATTAVFIGHRDCYELTEEAIIPKIEEAITLGVTTFLNGGMGHLSEGTASGDQTSIN